MGQHKHNKTALGFNRAMPAIEPQPVNPGHTLALLLAIVLVLAAWVASLWIFAHMVAKFW